ncbi:unnamed protein product [Rotaria socialis]|uniref:DET1- and DDB1-associated protein 1 domain-containing protein n=2 Tax=Rotaria socialis TaxID=392032 RepID=A0A821VT90_9BILA|nr:unnamed protein product [Rotaria socialis]
MSTNYVSFKTVKWCIMSSFLKDLPCRNPDSFTRLHSNGAIRQTSVRPTYTAAVDSNAKGIITTRWYSSFTRLRNAVRSTRAEFSKVARIRFKNK